MAKNTILHVVHDLGIGGVQESVKSCLRKKSKDFDFFTFSFEARGSSDRYEGGYYGYGRNNLISVFTLVYSIINLRPDVLVCSLWRSVMIGSLLKVLGFRFKFVVVIHSTKYSNFFDRISHRIGFRFSDLILADSLAAADSIGFGRDVKVISFKTKSISRVVSKYNGPNFAFWGRLNKVKRIDKAIDVFSGVVKDYPDAVFYIIGPDEGELSSLKNLASTLGIENNCRFLGALSFDEMAAIASKCSFYLQTSSYEGMGMSVIEAMALGLVPIVTPVGEISNYIIDKKNGYLLEKNRGFNLGEIEIRDFDSMSNFACETWMYQSLYPDDFFSAIKSLLISRNSDL